MGSSTKASFTPFVDPRVYQTSPTDEDEEDEESSAAGTQKYPGALGKAVPQRPPNLPHTSQKQFLGTMLCTQ